MNGKWEMRYEYETAFAKDFTFIMLQISVRKDNKQQPNCSFEFNLFNEQVQPVHEIGLSDLLKG